MITESIINEVINDYVNRIIIESVADECTIERCSPSDYDEMCTWLQKIAGNSREEIDEWFNETEISWDNTIKCVGPDGTPLGFLTMTNSPIEFEGPELKELKPELYDALSKLRSVEGFAFILDESIRGTAIHKKMLSYEMTTLGNVDYIIVPVYHELNTHNYWKRFGAIEILSNEELKLYVLPISQEAKIAIKQFN